MADEAAPQEITTEQVVTEAVETVKVDTNTEIGADVQGTEADKSDTADKVDADSVKDDAKAEKQYTETYVKKLRAEAANARVKGTEAATQAAKDAEKALTEKWAKALGLVNDDAPADPAELLKQAEAREAEIAKERDTVAERVRAYERKDAITAAVNKADGDLASILDSRSVNAEIEKLDTTADDFASQVEEIVKNAVETNPKLKKIVDRVSAPRSGGDLSGGNAAPTSHGPKTVEDFRREIAERTKRK